MSTNNVVDTAVSKSTTPNRDFDVAKIAAYLQQLSVSNSAGLGTLTRFSLPNIIEMLRLY